MKRLIEKTLIDLDVRPGTDAWKLIYDQAIAAADLLTRTELIKYIEESVENLPLRLFY